MKKFYFLLFTILMTSLSFGQVFITELADPNAGANARFIEIYNAGAVTVDFTEGNGWQLDKYTNTGVVADKTLDLTGTLAPGEFYIVATGPMDTEIFDVYGVTPDQWDPDANDVAGSNGDDKIALINGADVIVDIFGNPGDNSNNANDAQNFEDGRAERVATVTTGNPTWDAAEWNVDNDQGFGDGPQNAPGVFDPRAWIGVAGTCIVSLLTETITCNSNTAGDNNDGVIINIPYSGVDAAITSVSTTSGGTITGDDPAIVTSGTIILSGLSEGDAWDITLNGGNCDGTTSSGTIPSPQCDPSPLVINEVLYDPPTPFPDGDANGDGVRDAADDEFVEIYNISASSVDMEGFTLEDDFGVRHTFTGTVLPANSFITVFGGGTPTGISGISQIADDGLLGLGNGGDMMTLKNNLGIILDQVTYAGGDATDQSFAREPDFIGAFSGHLTHVNSRIFSPGINNDVPLSTNEFDVNNFSIYPNPTSTGFVTIASTNNDVIKVAVFDILGKQVKNETLSNNTLDVSNLNTGIYIMKISQNNASVTKKLVIR